MIYAIGLIGGLLGGMFGAGSGLIILPAMIKFLKVDEYKARGTTLAVVLIITVASAFMYYKNNFFDFSIATYIIIGGIIGGYLGAKIMRKISKFWLSIFFYTFMIFVGFRMIL